MDQSSQKKGGLVPISPSQTPRSSEKSSRDFRSVDGFNSKYDKDKGVNVQVILRCRPLNEEELRVNTPIVISCNEQKREVSASQNIANKLIDRTFAFDKVFGPGSQQKDLYNQSIVPIVNEVLEGYNCTIFAYGQTGTGKTYTMEGGGKKTKNGEFSIDAGVIPRAVRQIFEILEAQHAEYSMKVTFLELYNEEISDLLAPPDDYLKFNDDKQKKPIALMEDGRGGVFVRGLEEEIVCTANEIYKILERGSAKRRTAETLLNKQSSRSHSIFSITIHIKESTPEGEELIKCGKLNLVDLAGSENISRSGAREGRAREAGEINKSLLTLGRVINALVEHSGHIPYRESKLTRLLRDSLGGKTKTCIIATISPSIHCLEETLSTLDYAHRAKNIKNKPEINQKMMKSAMIKDLYSEIDRLKQEVYAAREKNGIYIPRDRYLQEEAEKKTMSERIERMELDLEAKDKQLAGLQELYDSQQQLVADLTEKLEKCQRKLIDTEHALSDLEERYKQANATIKEKEYLISNLLRSEKALVERAIELRTELENATVDVSGLYAKIERKDKIEEGNRVLVRKFQAQLVQQLELLHRTVSASVMQQEQQLKGLEEDMQAFVTTKSEATEALRHQVEKLKGMYGSGIKTLNDLAGELEQKSKTTIGSINSQVSIHSNALEDLLKRIALEATVVLDELQGGISNQERKLTSFVEQQREGHFRSIEATRSISKIAVEFFKTLDIHASKISQLLEETQTCQDQKLCELEKRFEECAANEEKLLLEKVAELLASSSARQKNLVQNAVLNLRKSATSRTNELQEGVSSVQDFTSSIKDEWTSYVGKTENYYLEDTAAVESGKYSLEEGLHECMKQAKSAREQWRNAQDSLLSLDKVNVEAVGSIVRSGLEANQSFREQLSASASTILEDVDIENGSLLTSIDNALKLDNDACMNVDSTIVLCFGELREVRSSHFHNTVEINEQAGKSLQQEYAVDEPSCTTPRRRPFNLPSIASIEELTTPPFEELIRLFWDTKSGRLPNGDAKQLAGMHDAQYFRDSRSPLTAIN